MKITSLNPKKYKLIKTYPSSPNLGEIVKQGDNKCYVGSLHTIYSTNHIENQPEFWKELKEPLFQTEDGIDMYEDDTYWTLRTKDNDWLFEDKVVKNINYFYSSEKDYSKTTGIYYFSTKKAAENYIICNKPCLSLNEILDTFRTVYGKDSIHYHCFKTNLKSLIKSKL